MYNIQRLSFLSSPTKFVQHFAYWYMKFHSNGNWSPLISGDARPAKPSAMLALVDYISATTWEYRIISGWFKALDPKKWEEYHACYQELLREGKLQHLDMGANKWGCFLGLVISSNPLFPFSSFMGGRRAFPPPVACLLSLGSSLQEEY